jgi:enoyl-CoA hydratase/carnithine racemase
MIGASQAKYLALSGERVTAADAQACGLVHEVVPHASVLERAHRLALAMASRAPISLQLTKQLINAASGEETGSTLEAMAGALAASTEDAAEGIRSFQDKRAPIYVGR